MVDEPLALVLSCEHAGNRVPAAYRPLFRGHAGVLKSHRGWDPGALDLARKLAKHLDAPLVATTVTRLLVEPNRSPHHPRVFSEYTRRLHPDEKARIRDLYYHPHRGAVEAVVRSAIRVHGRVVHVGVHTFTPVLEQRRRRADIGLLYDPARPAEALFCDLWMIALARLAPGLHVRRNYPYRGWSDGLTTTLRARCSARRYLGLELEVNQSLVGSAAWPRVQREIAASLALTLGAFGK